MTPASGSLLESLGWMAPVLGGLIGEQPGLASPLLRASRAHLHALALTLSLSECHTDVELVEGILTLPLSQAVHRIPVLQPRGMRRLLGRLPEGVLAPEDYRRAVVLLAEEPGASALRHAESVTPTLLANLAALPPRLRTPALARSFGQCAGRAELFLKWAATVGGRHSSGSAKAVLDLIAASRSRGALRSRLLKLLRELPLPPDAPPSRIGNAVRLDTATQVRAAGRRLRNCLVRRDVQGRRGDGWLYHWRNGAEEAACEVLLTEHTGWVLGDHLGPDNRALAPEVADRIRAAFDAAGIAPIAVDDAFEAVCGDPAQTSWRRRWRR